MADKFLIRGSHRLNGQVRIGGAKNAVLPAMAAAILTDEEIILRNCPRLTDVENMCRIMQQLGCRTRWEGRALAIDTSTANQYKMPEDLSRELRSSIFLMGPILARFGRAHFTHPGGCEIGLRPIDLHLKGLRALGTVINESMGHVTLECPRLTGAEIHLDYPSVGATENIIMASALAQGRTQIHNAAREPEIVDLARLLGSMGARILGAGGSVIEIEGVEKLHGTDHEVIPDRIAAGTYLIAAAMCGGTVELRNVYPGHLVPVIAKLRETGCAITTGEDSLLIKAPARLRAPSRVDTMPYPGFPTDMQAQIFVLSTIAEGTTILVENVFENRFHHAPELVRMGARVVIHDRMAIITGVDRLLGTRVSCSDLRGGAAMVLAGVCAEGVTVVEQIHHIDRGYELIENDLRGLGADIHRI